MEKARAGLAAISLGPMVLTGCGSHGESGPKTSPHLTPTKILAPSDAYATAETLKAPLTGAGTRDILRVTTSAGQYGQIGQLAITSAAGKTLLQVAHVGWVGVLG